MEIRGEGSGEMGKQVVGQIDQGKGKAGYREGIEPVA
jgi:hypothetical protein